MGIATQYEGGLKFDGDQMYITTSGGTTLLTLGNTGSANFVGAITTPNLFLGDSSVRLSPGTNGEVGINYNTSATGSLVWYAGGTASKFNVTNAGNATFAGTIGATNFSGSSSGTNTGDQTLPTASSLGAVTLTGTQTISGSKTFSSTSNHYKGHLYYDSYDSAGNHYFHFNDGAAVGGTTVNWRQYYGTQLKTHTWTSDSSGNMTFTFQGDIDANGGDITADNFSGSSSGTNTGDQDLSSYLTSVAFSDLTSKPSTLSGYGITDAVSLGTDNVFTGDNEFEGDLLRTNQRISNDQEYPLGHYTPGETVFELNTTWSNRELRQYFGNSNVSWDEVANAPGGYAVYINGGVSVGGAYNSGFPYIPIDQDGIYYMEVWIKNAGTAQGHYMGSIDYEADFSAPASGSGNPGSYGYWVMSNYTGAANWTKVSGYITGHHNSNTGAFETDATYWTPQALFNYSAGTGTRACWISGWKVIRVDHVGDRTFQDKVTFKDDINFDTSAGTTNTHAKIVYGQSPSPDGSLNGLGAVANYGADGYGLLLHVGYAESDNGGIKITDDGIIVWGASDENVFTVIDEDSRTERFRIDNSGNITASGTLSANGYNNSNWDTAYGWGDHGLSAQDKTDIGNLSGTNTGDQDLSSYYNSGGSTYTKTTGTHLSLKSTTNSGYSEFNMSNDVGHRLVMGSVGSTYSNTAWAGSRYIYASAGELRIKAATNLRLYSGGNDHTGDLAVTFDSSQDATFTGTIAASNFSGSSSGTNTGDQTLPTLSSLGGASSGYLTNTGGAKLEIQNGQDGGSSYGIYMWTSSNTDWGIYMAQAGDNKALNDGTASAGIDGATAHAIRFRVNDNSSQAGFIWENNSNETLMQLNGGSEKLYTKNAIYPSNQTTNYVDSTRIANWQTAYTDRNKWDGGSTGLTASTGRASLGLGTAATAAATAFATSGHNHAGVYALEYELMQSDNSDRDMHVWRKNHAMLSDDSGINTYIIVQTNVPQDNNSMGGFTLVYQDDYYNSGEGGEIKIYGYWNPESNGGFEGFRYECSNPYHTPTIEVCRNSTSGDTAFFISGEGGSYTQLIAKDLWLGFAASSATSQWGDSWTITQADAKDGYTNFDTLNRNDFSAITTNGSTPSLTGGVTAAEVRTLIGAGTGNGSSDFDGAYSSLSGTPTLGSAATTSANAYATAAQGTKADNAAPKDYESIANLGSPDAISGTWVNAGTTDWGTPRIGSSTAKYTDGTGYIQFDIPSGMKTAYLSQLTWSSGGYFHIYGIQSDGGAVLLRVVNSKNSVENTNEGNPNQHDGSTTVFAGTGLDNYSAIRITNKSGRLHLTGLGFTSSTVQGAEGMGLVHPNQLSTSLAYSALSGLPTLGTAAATASTDYATASHTHAASDITSGTLAIARIPTVDSKISEFIENKHIYQRAGSIGVYMPMVKGGLYATSSSSKTGKLKIKLPSYKTAMMISFRIDVYEYNTDRQQSYIVSGYAYNDTAATWYNTSAICLSDSDNRNLVVRFYSDTTAGEQYVTIGETNSDWVYPQVVIRDVFGGYNTSISELNGTWGISFIEDEAGTSHAAHSDNSPIVQASRVVGELTTSNIPQLAYTSLSGLPTLGTAAAAATGDFATAAQGTTADAALPKAGGTMTGSLTIGDGSAATRLIIKRVDSTVADDIQFYNGTTRVGEIGTTDTTWLRINQNTSKNIYTPRYIRADNGFFVDGTAKGINGSGNFIGGTITGASDANVSNWDTAYGWGDHSAAGYGDATQDYVGEQIGAISIPSGNAIIDWTADQGNTNIHSGNYINTTYSAGGGLDLTGTTFSVEPDLRDGITHVGKDANNYIQFDSTNGRIDFYAGGVFVARMESDGDLHMKGDVIAFSDIF